MSNKNKKRSLTIYSCIFVYQTGYLKVKSIDTSKLNDVKTKKRSTQYQQITERWRNDFIDEINKARETRKSKGQSNLKKIRKWEGCYLFHSSIFMCILMCNGAIMFYMLRMTENTLITYCL